MQNPPGPFLCFYFLRLLGLLSDPPISGSLSINPRRTKREEEREAAAQTALFLKTLKCLQLLQGKPGPASPPPRPPPGANSPQKVSSARPAGTSSATLLEAGIRCPPTRCPLTRVRQGQDRQHGNHNRQFSGPPPGSRTVCARGLD